MEVHLKNNFPLDSLSEVHLQKIFRSLRSRRYTLKFFPLAALAEVHLKNYTARFARGGTPSKNFPLATLAKVHLKADFYLSHGHIHLYLCICPENFQKSPGHIHIKMGPDIYTGGGGGGGGRYEINDFDISVLVFLLFFSSFSDVNSRTACKGTFLAPSMPSFRQKRMYMGRFQNPPPPKSSFLSFS